MHYVLFRFREINRNVLLKVEEPAFYTSFLWVKPIDKEAIVHSIGTGKYLRNARHDSTRDHLVDNHYYHMAVESCLGS